MTDGNTTLEEKGTLRVATNSSSCFYYLFSSNAKASWNKTSILSLGVLIGRCIRPTNETARFPHTSSCAPFLVDHGGRVRASW
jgi:hypothetical protein